LTELLDDQAAAAFLADLAAEGLVKSDESLPEPLTPKRAEGDRETPRIEWREEVRRLAGACGHYPAGGEVCLDDPFTS
jgi:hypothetical protein